MSHSARVYAEKPVKSLWDQICDEYAAQKANLEEIDIDDNSSVATDVTQYSARRHTPVLYGKMVHEAPIDADVASDFDPALSHPATIGLTMLNKPSPQPTPEPVPPPDPKTCTPKEYLEAYVFPTLMPAIIAMLNQAKKEQCFERKRFRFNGCDFLTKFLYQNHPDLSKVESRKETDLLEIPFVKSWNDDHPREPLPLSLQWSEEEAALKIQSFYRGHQVRVGEEVSELRKWQKEWREKNRNIRDKVDQFWDDQESKGRRTPSGNK